MGLDEYFRQYELAHRHWANRACHKAGIPLIILGLILLIFSSQKNLGWILFGAGWVFQVLGHAIEKSWPEFLTNPLYLLIGPLYFFRGVIRRPRKP